MARRARDTRDVDKAYGRKRLAAARAFMEQATRSAAEAADEYERAAAASSAILAAIAAADAACAQRLGQVWKGEHAQAHDLLRRIAGGEQVASALQRVVSQKTQIQYLGESLTEARLTAALRQAQAVLDFAERIHES
jgi:hypothetical protein